MTDIILVINAGSSSLKFEAFPIGGEVRMVRGQVDEIGTRRG